jgi:hypothetical protein
MPVTTAKLALRTPVTADNNDTPTFMLNLATDIVSSLDFGTFASRPAATVANQGRRYYATDRDREYFNNTAGAWQTLGGDPPGVVQPFLVTAIPTGWLLLDGITVTGALTTYPDLWAVLPAVLKSGSDFLTPDFRTRTVIGADAFGVGAAGARGNLAGLDPGEQTGANTKTISVGHLPVHTHDMSHNHSINNDPDGGHFHSVGSLGGSAGADGLAQLAQVYNSGATTHYVPSTLTSGGARIQTFPVGEHTHSNSINAVSQATGSVGSGTALNVVGDSIAVVWCVRT